MLSNEWRLKSLVLVALSALDEGDFFIYLQYDEVSDLGFNAVALC